MKWLIVIHFLVLTACGGGGTSETADTPRSRVDPVSMAGTWALDRTLSDHVRNSPGSEHTEYRVAHETLRIAVNGYWETRLETDGGFLAETFGYWTFCTPSTITFRPHGCSTPWIYTVDVADDTLVLDDGMTLRVYIVQ